jgi:RHS repeat-associated protein
MTYSRCGTGQCIGGSVAAASGAHLWDATHDEAGKRTRFVTLNPPITWDYGYDERQQLTQVWWNGALREENAYNYAGDRARKVYYDAGGLTTTTYYVGDSYELRINSLNPHAVASTHRVAGLATVTAGNRIFGQASEAATLAGRSSPLGGSTITGSSQGTWLHLGDHLGSAAVTAQGGSGSAVERLAHEPFGGLLRANSIGVDGHTHKFAGQELDEESGLLKSGARYYDSVTARFMTADSLLPIADRGAQYYNRFSYVLNNPLRFVDPSGHFEEELQALKLGALRQILVIGGHVALLFETTDQGTYDRTIAAYDKRLAELDHPFWQEVGENIVVQLATPPIPGGEIEVPEGTKFLWAKKPPIVVEPAITGENPTVGVEKGPTDTRVKLRKYVREEIEQNQPRNEAGEKIDPNTRQSLKEGEIDVGHKHGQEWRVRKEMHKQRGSTRKEVIETENDSDLYELQDRSENRSHRHEKKP